MKTPSGAALNNIGLVYHDQRRYTETLESYQEALEIADSVGDRERKGTVLSHIGLVYQEQGDYDEALTNLLKAVEVIEDIRAQIKVEEFKSGFSATKISTYNALIDLLVQQERDEEAFGYLQRAKARTFLDQLGNGQLDFRAGAEAELLAREQGLREQISARRSQLVTLRNRPREEWDVEAIGSAEEELKQFEKEYGELLIEIKLQSPEVAALVSVDVATLDEVQAQLEPDVTLVEYFVTDEQILIFLVTRDSFEVVESSVSRDKLADEVSSLRSAFKFYRQKPELFGENSQQLYEWLIAPISDKLTSHLIIAPSNVLHYLPFAALSRGETYLVDQYTITTVPSASVLRFLREKRKPESGHLLALGNPQTTEALPPLPFAVKEVQSIAKMYQTEALIGSAASEEEIWNASQQADIIHLAAHGQYNQFNPSFSTLYLAASDSDDGRLEVHELYGLDLTQATNLVVLSACETQLPENFDTTEQSIITAGEQSIITAGDEIVALNRAFLYAGTPSVIATLWLVDDEATSLLMQRFYSYLQAGKSKANALRLAQEEMRADEKYAHPYYWAGFVLTGDGGDVLPITQGVSIWWVVGGGLLLLVIGLIVAGIWRQRRKALLPNARRTKP